MRCCEVGRAAECACEEAQAEEVEGVVHRFFSTELTIAAWLPPFCQADKMARLQRRLAAALLLLASSSAASSSEALTPAQLLSCYQSIAAAARSIKPQ